ncbi:hypothetical protein RvY_12798 [Ramazzottius varieornatus]|uniref:DUF1279 domain-containing protein n=1 Tax=Ramazzottius varieornatus TaxID=947166 RepID=A0A1D1VPU7_RAMVA|nr:hypothetical protein RvY_12798 [Ramazzottius varieornatus]
MLNVGITCAFAHGRSLGRCTGTSGPRLARLLPAVYGRSTWYLASSCPPAVQGPPNTSSIPMYVPVRCGSSSVQEAAASSMNTPKDTNVNPTDLPPVRRTLSVEEPTVVKPLTSREKLRAAIRDYGSTVLVFHVASGCTFLSMWYLIVSSGVDLSSLIRTLGLEGRLSSLAGGATTFVVAYAIHKATAPLRIGFTLTAAPLIVNYLRRKGVMKVKAKV